MNITDYEAPQEPITIYTNTDFNCAFEEIDTATGAAIDFTGCTAKAEVRDETGTLLLTLDAALSSGLLVLTAAHDNIKDLPPQTAYWDCYIIDSLDKRKLWYRKAACVIAKGVTE